jgi:GGDEF domain-containing protein
VRKERKQRDGGFENRLLKVKSRLDELVGLLLGMVDRVLLERGFDPKTFKFDNQPDRKIETNQQSHRLTPSTSPAGEPNVPYDLAKPIVEETGERETPNSFGLPVPPCPICGVIPHNWSIHEEWRHTRGDKGPEKLAADREAFPAHECVDRPTLPCPACLKWTGDGFASVRNSQCFPGITDKLPAETMQHDTSGYAVMVRVRLVDRWAWTTWMRYDTYEQAAAHKREGHKIVPLGSAEWAALRQSAEPALPPNAAQRKTQRRDFVHGVLSWLDEWEIRELERMHTNRAPAGVETLRNGFHWGPKENARKRLLVSQDAVKPPNRERRVDLEKRQRTAEMSPEEMQRELLTSEVTGLPNRRAFDEAGAATAVAMSDVDGLKALNDKYGYDAGDALLKAKAVALRQARLEAYHDKGDEFWYRGNSIEELRADLECARGILRNHTIVVERADGSTLRFTGADFSYGIGKDIAQAETRLKSHKAERKARGELKRGELRGIIKRGSRKSPIQWN